MLYETDASRCSENEAHPVWEEKMSDEELGPPGLQGPDIPENQEEDSEKAEQEEDYEGSDDVKINRYATGAGRGRGGFGPPPRGPPPRFSDPRGFNPHWNPRENG